MVGDGFFATERRSEAYPLLNLDVSFIFLSLQSVN